MLLTVIVPSACFAVLELGTRAFVHVPTWIVPSPAACTQRDRLLGYSYIPHCIGRLGGTPLRTNALGLRGEEVPDDATPRILAIGDSCTWGYEVPERSAYPVLLGQLLNIRARGTRYRVINAGVAGSTSHHGVLYLRERGLALRPALVLLGYQFNDALEMGNVETRLERTRQFYEILLVDDWMRQHSSFYRMVAIWLGPRAMPTLERQVMPENYRENVTTMVRLARDHGARVVLIDWNMGNSPYLEILDELSTELDVPLVRFYGPRIPGDLIHPTAEGYRRFVTVLYDRLRQAGYIDGG